eukprot:jgi/Chlat1/1194/Chrsp115S01670
MGKGGDGGGGAGGGVKRKRGLFSKELRLMMYGFGDDPQPLQESVDLVEELVVDYLTDMMHKALDVSSRRGRLQTEDIIFLIRKDLRKYKRAQELLRMYEELKRVRKGFEVDETALAKDEE